MAGFPDIFGAFKPSEGTVPVSAADAVRDPTTGLWYNRRTGNWSTDAAGINVITSPNTQSQAAQAIALANGLQGRFSQLSGQYDKAYADQGSFLNQLAQVISGQAPSVAGGQLQQGLGQIRAQQDSMASGYSGINALVARMAAMQNAQRAGSDVNQQQALLRAQEIAGARNTLGDVLGQRVSGSGAMANDTQRAGLAARGIAGTDRSAYETGARDDAKANVDLYGRAASGIGSALATGGASGAGRAGP